MERCPCHRPLSPPQGRHWWPCRDPEPGPDVCAVVLSGDEPSFLRKVRRPDGWHGEGVAAAHPDAAAPEPWAATGRCWAGTQHPVEDATHHVEPARPAPPARGLP